MLSVSTAAVHRPIRPKTPESSPSPPSQVRKDSRRWNCEYTVFPKRQCRPSPARKRIISSVVGKDSTIGIDVHCQTVRFEQPSSHVEPIFKDSTCQNSVNSASDAQECRSPRAVTFLKSSTMQERVKVSRAREEDAIDDTLESVVKNHDNENETEEEERVFDKSKRQKLENCEKNDKREKSGRMSRALNNLLAKESEQEEEYLNLGEPGIRGIDTVEKPETNFTPIMEDNGWDSDAELTMLRDLRDPTTSQDNQYNNDSYNDDCSEKKNEPHWTIGFPNPPGENRCWLNATLHALFSLPLIDYIEDLDGQQLRECSQLTKTLVALRVFWKSGNEGRQKTHQTLKMFKESLGILDESYPSQRQQDVSEFLTMFLNYLKTDFEKITSGNTFDRENLENETENIADNSQDNRVITRSPQTPVKRPPLADISPCKRKFNTDPGLENSPKIRKNNLTYSVRDLMSPRVNRLSNPTDPTYKVHTPPHNRDRLAKDNEENLDYFKNPIDRYFLLHMMEHYVCKGCEKHRQRKVDNLMIYIDLLADNENETVYLDKSIKNTREPEERTLTCGKCKYGKHKVFTTFRVCPKILMVQINRYGMCSDGSVAKFNTPVDIPEVLQLDLGVSDTDNVNPRIESFEPVCVIAHVGSAMDCGHYTSYVRHDESWYHYNDLTVTPMSRHEALSAAQTTAYVVFFANTKL